MLNITLRGLYRPVAFACRHRAYHLKRNFLPAFSERGIIADMFPHEAGNELAAHLDSSTRTVYAGFDPTADSLHLGNLLVLNALLHSLRAGHNVIALIGGATAMIGDPSGKNEERPEMSGSQVANNVRGITDDLKRIFENHAKFFSGGRELSDARIVDNNDWYKERNLLHFLSTTGRHFRLGRMMARDSVKKRIESGDGISLTEFSYQVFQAYDWYHLNRAFQCTVQFGGSDQMGNMTAGYDLCSRALDLTVYSVTLPLVTSESGEKLGKTAGASVWLSEERTSCFDFYQYFLRRHDNEIEKMLKLFSFCSDSEISDLMSRHFSNTAKRIPHTKLAEQMTLLVHGERGLQLAKKATDVFYGGGDPVTKLAALDANEMKAVFDQADFVRLLYSAGMCLLDFAMKIGCFKNEKVAAKIINAGGFYINQVRRQNAEEVIMPGTHILPNQMTLVRVGKRNYYVVDWTM